MNSLRTRFLRHTLAWLLTVAMVLPALVGCVTKPPPTVRIDGIVVNGQRQARPDETGLARVMRSGTTMEARKGMELQTGDRVETGHSTEIVIRYPSGTEVFMRGNSSGRIGSVTEFVGELFVKVKGIFSVDSNFVKAGARGTAYLVQATERGTTTVTVFEGTVVVDSTTGAWPPVSLERGFKAVAYPRPPQTSSVSAEELQRTTEWVDRLEKMVPEASGVSGAGVAVAVGITALVAAILAGRDKSPKTETQNEQTGRSR